MMQHMEQGRRTEIDALNGALVREAKALGIAVPYNKAVVAIVKGPEKSRRQLLHEPPRDYAKLETEAAAEARPARPCLTKEHFGQRTGRVDNHAPEALAVESTEMGAVTGHESLAFEANRRGKYWPIFLGECQRGFDSLGIRVGSRDTHACEEGVQNRKALRRLGREIAPRLFGDIPIRAAFMAGVDQERQEPPDGAVRPGCREKNVGVQEDPHPRLV